MNPTAPTVNVAARLADELPANVLDQIESRPGAWLVEACDAFDQLCVGKRYTTTDAALKLAVRYGFDASVPWLVKEAQAGRFLMPQSLGVEFVWEGHDVLRLFRHLHTCRRWTPTCHDFHKTPDEIAREQREIVQAGKMLKHFRSLSLEELGQLEPQLTNEYTAVMLRTAVREKQAAASVEGAEA